MVFPESYLPPESQRWGKEVVSQIEQLGREAELRKQDTVNNNKQLNSTISSLSQQVLAQQPLVDALAANNAYLLSLNGFASGTYSRTRDGASTSTTTGWQLNTMRSSVSATLATVTGKLQVAFGALVYGSGAQVTISVWNADTGNAITTRAQMVAGSSNVMETFGASDAYMVTFLTDLPAGVPIRVQLEWNKKGTDTTLEVSSVYLTVLP